MLHLRRRRLYTWEVNKYEENKEEEYIDIDDSGVGDITY